MILSLPKRKQTELLEGMTDDEILALCYDWEFWARPKQLPPPHWFIWMVLSGRGFGKTRAGNELVIKWAKEGHSPIALIGETARDVRDTMVEVHDSAILNISPPWFMPEYEPSKQRLVWPNGVVALLYYGDTPNQLRGPQHAKALIDELAKFRYPQLCWDNLMFGMRQGDEPQIAITTTPRPIPIIKNLNADLNVVVVSGHTLENQANLPQPIVDYWVSRYEGTRTGRQELAGEILDDNPDALWNRDIIDKFRVIKHPELVRLVIAIDPEAQSHEESAETGIIAAGRDRSGQYYVLEDFSLRDKPDKWGFAAVSGYFKLKADLIVGEANNGGEMVEHVIRTVPDGHSVAYKMVHASRGKQTRAEPVASAYENGKIHHVGNLAVLEDQMCEWVPGIGSSPDRVDALVWALTELGIGKEVKLEKIVAGSREAASSRYE